MPMIGVLFWLSAAAAVFGLPFPPGDFAPAKKWLPDTSAPPVFTDITRRAGGGTCEESARSFRMIDPALRDVVVIGGSAGAGKALQVVLEGLPPGFSATVFVTRHLPPQAGLPRNYVGLTCGPLTCVEAEDGIPFRRGHVYFAPPEHHLLVGREEILLRRGPRENGSRPAVDPMFRSAAANHAGRVVGIVLSGYLDDGTSGLRAVKRCGGLAVVQHPDDADYPDMPGNAIEHTDVDYILPASRIGPLLCELVRQPAPQMQPVPPDIRLEAGMSANAVTTIDNEFRLGQPSEFSCPDCGGVLWRYDGNNGTRFRCHVGHAYSEHSLADAQSSEVDRALWAAFRALREKTRMLHQLADQARERQQIQAAGRYGSFADECGEEAERIRSLLGRSRTRSRPPPSEAASRTW